MGLVISVSKIVDAIYADLDRIAAEHHDDYHSFEETRSSKISSVNSIRQSLGHPFAICQTVQCLVCSSNGLDAQSIGERLTVAASLWSEGIRTEYISQSGVLMSLLREGSVDRSGAFDTVSSSARSGMLVLTVV